MGDGTTPNEVEMKCRAEGIATVGEDGHSDGASDTLFNTPDWAMQKRRNNVTISKAMVYAANGQREQAETLHREYQQFQCLGALDKAAEGLYLSMTGRYDEAVRLFDETDSMMRSNGEPVIDLYVKTLFNYKYDALQKAGRTEEALALGDRIRQLTDSIRQCSKGETVGDFINRYRLEHVARLLKTTEDPIAIIGELSGIPSRATLARLFRNAYGMTPTEYRKI
ncbi:MAG: helix-turn-helix transcriptional regulator [Prevotella sp.]|nr:helix-turn-helix transcriptional regulator [Prevotella sp.]